MFVLIERREEVASAQRRLEATLRKAFRRNEIKNIGYPGGSTPNAEVRTDGRYWFRSADHRGRNVAIPRRLNWFGRFNENTGLGITVEINITYLGRNDQIGGFFARDSETGIVYLLHSGRVGGGTKGVGKNAFRAWAGAKLVEASDSKGLNRHGLLVMPIDGGAAVRSATRYIDLVTQFKKAVRVGEIQTAAFQRKQKEYVDFYREARGRRRGRRASEIDYVSRHGEIVDALHLWRKSRAMPKAARVVKNILIDMGIAVGKDLVEIFEVKPSAARSSIYSALGQLMVHGKTHDCQRTLVLPTNEMLPPDLTEALTRLQIGILRFRLSTDKAAIVGTG